jgi:hypothetical protein
MHLFVQRVFRLWCTAQSTILTGSAAPTTSQNNGEVRGQGCNKTPYLIRKTLTEMHKDTEPLFHDSWFMFYDSSCVEVSDVLVQVVNYYDDEDFCSSYPSLINGINSLSFAVHILLRCLDLGDCPRSAITKMQQDWRKPLARIEKWQLRKQLNNTDKRTVNSISHNRLNTIKVCARLVRGLLKREQKQTERWPVITKKGLSHSSRYVS